MARAMTRVAFALACVAPALSAQQQKCPAVTGATMPREYHGTPTVAAITPCDLMTRLYIYSADSMRGREAGTPDAIRATGYIEAEVRRLGLKPAGDRGTYFQYLPVTARSVSKASTITAGGKTFHSGVDFVAQGNADRKVTGEAVFGGTAGDTTGSLTPEEAKGKVVVLLAPAGGAGGRGGFGGGRGRGGNNPLSGAEAIVTVSTVLPPTRAQFVLNDTVQNEGRDAYNAANPQPAGGRGGRGGRGAFGGGNAINVTVTPRVAAAMLGKAARSRSTCRCKPRRRRRATSWQFCPAPTRCSRMSTS